MKIKARIIPGYGAASGKSGDARYPYGTIRMQQNCFLDRGLDIRHYYMGTVNVDISPFGFEIKRPKYFFEKVKWSDHIPPENFYFFDVTLHFNNKGYAGLIYMPDPSTKVEHVQSASTLELILPEIEELNYEDEVTIELNTEQINIQNTY